MTFFHALHAADRHLRERIIAISGSSHSRDGAPEVTTACLVIKAAGDPVLSQQNAGRASDTLPLEADQSLKRTRVAVNPS